MATNEPDLFPCQGVDAELFFSPHVHEIARAKAVCAGCGVRRACLRLAVARAEPCGVWGGELLLNGTPIPAPRRRGRPRRDAAA